VARLFVFLIGKRGIVLACAAFAAVLSAKGMVHTNGLHDGPG
jgi:hypothetical protein